MLLADVRGLALADVTEPVLRQLVDHGESLHVERKAKPPASPRLGAAAASFANMLGGFILLGVADDKTVKGWKPPGRAEAQTYVASLLREQVDPLPPFVAEMRELDGKDVAVIRVFESVDTPHIVRGTGAIYVRSSGSKEPVPVDDYALVLEMARRGREAEVQALRRLAETPSIVRLLTPPDGGRPPTYEPAEVVARATPLTIAPSVREWALTRRAADATQKLSEELAPRVTISGFEYARQPPELIPIGRGFAARTIQEAPVEARNESFVLVDSAGVVAAAIRRRPGRAGGASLLVEGMRDGELLPLANALVSLLHDAEAIGRVAIDVWVLLSRDDVPMTRGAELIGGELHASRTITTPASDADIEALASSWHREIQRNLGIVKFEGE